MVSVDMGPVDVSRARAVLGFQPTPLGVVVTKTLAWLEKPSHRKYTRDLDRSSSSDDDDGDEEEEEDGRVVAERSAAAVISGVCNGSGSGSSGIDTDSASSSSDDE